MPANESHCLSQSLKSPVHSVVQNPQCLSLLCIIAHSEVHFPKRVGNAGGIACAIDAHDEDGDDRI